MPEEEAADVVVVGSGAGGLAAAVTAAIKGLSVIVLEKSDVVGGTTAISGGGTWIPCNPIARRLGIADSREAARSYFERATGNRFDGARIDAFLDKGPEMVEFLESTAGIPFTVQPDRPDYHPEMIGASQGGRVIYAAPFNGRALGASVHRLRPPLRQLTLFGLMVKPGPDLKHFLNVWTSWASFRFVANRILRHTTDMVRFGRGMDLGNGNALIGRLMHVAAKHKVDIRTASPVSSLITDDARITGVEYKTSSGETRRIHSRYGVVLATGGYPHDANLQKKLMKHVRTGDEQKSASVATNTGDGIRMAEAVGAAFDSDLSDVAAWAPVSLVPRPDGPPVRIPHLIDRQKPGFIAVTRDGRRFVNESDSYHAFVRGLLQATPDGSPPEAFLIADHATLRRYGMGAVKPAPIPLTVHLRSGYLIRGNTIAELASRAGIAEAALAATVETFNKHARDGEDPEFHRGSNVYQRYNGDPAHKPNPCVAPIAQGPFYAVRIYAGDLGTFAGLKTDASARVLRSDGEPIEGLYAVGSDMAHIMAGEYLSGGANLGPALTFGYIAGCELADLRDVTERASVS